MKRGAKSLGSTSAVLLLVCACWSTTSKPIPEPTLDEICERRCAPIGDPTSDVSSENHPCHGNSPPDDCVARCVEHIETTVGIGDPESCRDCLTRSLGWRGRRVVRHTGKVLGLQTSCESIHYRGATIQSSKTFNFTRCEESSLCEGFIFEEPGDGTYCGPRCGYELIDPTGPSDAGTSDEVTTDAGMMDTGTTDAATTNPGSSDGGTTGSRSSDAETTGSGSSDADTTDTGPNDTTGTAG